MIIQAILALVFVFLVWKSLKKPDNYPPGLWGVPGFGYVPLGGAAFPERLKELNEKHGDVILWRMGTQVMIFLFDYKMIKEAFTKTNDFVDRPQNGIFNIIQRNGENVGLVASNGQHWHSLRRFALKEMRDLGMGKSRMVSAVHNEANCLVELLKSRSGVQAPLPHTYVVAVLNIIWQMIASKRYDLNDEPVTRIVALFKFIQNNAIQFSIPMFMPWLEKIMPTFIYNRICRKDKFDMVREEFYKFMLVFVNEHQKAIDYDDPRDFIDAYLVEMKKQENDAQSTLSERDLIACIADLFIAGSETTSNNLLWASLYLAKYPQIQKKLQNAVDDEMPKGTLPSLEDRVRLPYVEAFIHEIHRHASLISNGVMHVAIQDTKLGGYHIPKNSTVSGVHFACHFNPKHWDEPEKFNPERFLDADGKFKNISEGFLPFGVGKRQCIGESLARIELFVFVTAFAQHLTFSAPPGKKIDLSCKSENPFIRLPWDKQEIIITAR